MALVKMTDIMTRAQQRGAGVGAFSIYNLASLRAAIQAAEALELPSIIMIAEKRFPSAPFEYVAPAMMSAAKNAKVDIAVHLDHGESLEVVQQALDMGFTSVMFDGSSLPFDENVANTLKVMEMAKPFGAAVEAELGCLGTKEDGTATAGEKFTRPEEAKEFLRLTKVDALAIAIGNAHGNYKAKPDLQFDILKQIHEENPGQHLVLHGGSGISDADFQKCIANGITKINVATAMLNAIMKRVDDRAKEEAKPDYYPFFEEVVGAVQGVVEHHMRVFDMQKI
ncbi:MAG: ketose-bisphosphate aldolase [Lachnospiraceae bacterium]|nr:ketose-bisphosphate aldolase [Lachnospiraceae bacterium]